MVKNSISYKIKEGVLDENIYRDVTFLYLEIFKDADLVFFKQRIHEYPKLLSILAYEGKNLVGFKIGYPYNPDTFYSWAGGVLREYRAKGIANNLAQLQEQKVKEKGYKKLRTKSMNRFKPMMILNLKNGFDIINIYTNTKGQKKIVFEKYL